MAVFKYKAISKSGKEFIGLLAKKDKYSAKKYLECKGLFVCRLSSDNHLSRRVNESDLIEFFMHLFEIINA